jgi:hypothetical protein
LQEERNSPYINNSSGFFFLLTEKYHDFWNKAYYENNYLQAERKMLPSQNINVAVFLHSASPTVIWNIKSEWLKIFLRIWKFTASILGPGNDYPGYFRSIFQSVRADSGTVIVHIIRP